MHLQSTLDFSLKYSTNMPSSTTHWLIRVSRHSATYQPSVDWVLIEFWLTWWLSVSLVSMEYQLRSGLRCWSSVDQGTIDILNDTRPYLSIWYTWSQSISMKGFLTCSTTKALGAGPMLQQNRISYLLLSPLVAHPQAGKSLPNPRLEDSLETNLFRSV